MAAVAAAGGEVDGDTIRIPRSEPVPPALEQWSMGVPTREVLWDDSAWKWSGAWEDKPFKSYRERAAKESVQAGDVAELSFTGSAISVVGNLSGSGGLADVFLDGVVAGRINAYIIDRTTDSNLWHTYGLDHGPHTLRIVTLEEADPRSSGNILRIHRAIVFRPE